MKKNINITPAIVILAIQWLTRFILPMISEELTPISVMSGIVGFLLLCLWWFFFTPIPRHLKWSVFGTLLGVMGLMIPLMDKSISTAMMGLMLPFYITPFISLAFVLWLYLFRHTMRVQRLIYLFLLLLIPSFSFMVIRTDGMHGNAKQDFTWRWSASHEEHLLKNASGIGSADHSQLVKLEGEIKWAGFRGNERNAIVRGTSIHTDWKANPPREKWRHPIGPGIASFAIQGNYFFTQEQLGEHEIVSCYELQTGKTVWQHKDKARFWDSHAGAGPRSTPTLYDGWVYTLGATGLLNVLDAKTGKEIWSREADKDVDVEPPGWGFASSPLVTEENVIVALEGELAAYDRKTGAPQWYGPDGGEGYSSPQLFSLKDQQQVVFLRGDKAMSLSPDKGNILWEIPNPGSGNILQPAMINEKELLLSSGERSGIYRVALKENDQTTWTATEKWHSTQLKPYFSDFLLYDGFAYCLHQGAMACIDIQTGERIWKGGKYGSGQNLLLADQQLLLVVSEKGELALLEANPQQHVELGRIQAVKGKTWNHPAMVGNIILIRNGYEMVAFEL